jgi:hypothetical protein
VLLIPFTAFRAASFPCCQFSAPPAFSAAAFRVAGSPRPIAAVCLDSS